MADKDFVVKNGLAVNGSILVVNTSTGSVGIGTSSPNANLTVSGTANVSGNAVFSANVTVTGSRLSIGTAIVGGANATLNIMTSTNVVATNISGNGAAITSANATEITTGTLNTARLPATANISTAINVGANVNLTTSGVSVGNSTVNAAATAGSITINGTTLVANASGVHHTGTINASSLTVGSAVIANTAGVFTTGAVNAASVNASSLTVGSSLVGNSTGLFHTGSVNALSMNVTTITLGGNVTVNTSGYSVGNTTVNFVVNSSAITATGPGTLSSNVGLHNILTLNGSTSGTTNLVASSTASGTVTIPAGTSTLATTSNKLSAFAATTSAELASVISDETGSGVLVFNNSPTMTGTLTVPNISAAASSLNYNASAGNAHIFSINSAQQVAINTSGVFPWSDNSIACGTSGNRWSDLRTVTATLSGALTYGGVTLSNAVTGTGNMVLSASPTLTGTLTVPTINASAAYQFNNANLLLVSSGYTLLYDGSQRQNLLLGGTGDASNYYRNTTHYLQTVGGGTTMMSATASAVTLNVPLNYGGVTLSNSVTGTGSMVLSASPTFTGVVSSNGVTITFPSTSGGAITYADPAPSGQSWQIGPGAGTGSPAEFNIYNNTTAALLYQFGKTGNFTAAGDITSTSDIGLKSNIEVINNALDKLSNIKGITFNSDGVLRRRTGVIAQDVQAVLPEAVHANSDGYLSVAYGNMVGLLVEAIKELKAEVERLKNGKPVQITPEQKLAAVAGLTVDELKQLLGLN